MTLSKLLEGVVVRKMFQTMYGHMVVTHDVEVRQIQYDSRKVGKGDAFVALRGTAADGAGYIPDAINGGARVVVMENDGAVSDSFFMHTGVVKIIVPDSRIALAQMSANYYGRPADRMLMIGVTGTNGKTTTTHLLRACLEAGGRRTGLIGTISYRIGDRELPATHTTPESLELNSLLADMVSAGCSSAVMEVSSHALAQHRVEGIPFRAAVFTNLTQDHLDYHGTMEDYFGAKKILFDRSAPDSWSVVNADDPWGKRLLESAAGRKMSYAISAAADVHAANVSLSMRGTRLDIVCGHEETAVESILIGRFNVSNILAAFAAGIAVGIPAATLAEAIRTAPPVRGRFEPVASPRGWTAIIDYAHTPDALEKALGAVHDVFESAGRGRIITVFGCGGNRDRTKRPKMAAIAAGLSDLTIITSDNPRHEDPDAIIDEIMQGVLPGRAVEREPDRRKAIVKALDLAHPGDVVLIAGKGHEDYQVIGDRKIHFSDREEVEEYLRTHA